MKPYSPFDKKPESVKAKANATEKKLAKKLGGRTQPSSGAFPGLKGDIKTDAFLFDSKETVHNSISVKKEDLMKITKEANIESKHPALVLTIGNQEWVCLPLNTFKEMVDLIKES